MQLLQQVSLRPYNTFGIDVVAEHFTTVNDVAQLPEVSNMPYACHILGGGSNILLTGPVSGLVIQNGLRGISTEHEDDHHVWLRVQSGEAWHGLVMHAIDMGLGGIENLALIPGTAGASPMQNIGAYGVEAASAIESVTFWHWEDRAFYTLTNAECMFGYRDSIFKRQLKDKTFITSVLYRLDKQPTFHTTYGAIGQQLEAMGVQELTVAAIANAVIRIRTEKLPDPKVIGNAGSFFKNPTITAATYAILQGRYPNMPHYPAAHGMVKVPAGWLIEQCGWKGYRRGDAGVHAHQALVLVNYGQANGQEIEHLSGEIMAAVEEKYSLLLEREVQMW